MTIGQGSFLLLHTFEGESDSLSSELRVDECLFSGVICFCDCFDLDG